MAVPKKRTSKSKGKSRKATWKRKAYFQAQNALSLAKSSLSGKSTSFIYQNIEQENTPELE
uniref:ribosomal protein L32 n=1 Tax=Rhodaphanes brevistipitata TaxID=446136 RepID=UPI001FCCF864|nr:ribosomal protein L32 [Rhodaphanes brevistipitata]UNJ18428.1 ribosomal protein L32 [Rhodaphanes brevistipitata]